MAFITEWHIQAQQDMLIERLSFYWWERGCLVEMRDGPQDLDTWVLFQNTPYLPPADAPLREHLLVSATEAAGWTVVWPVSSPWFPELWMYLSGEMHVSVLVGEYHSIVDQSHWSWFEHGRLQAEHYTLYTGKMSSFHLDPTRQPTGTMQLNEAFAVFDRTFNAPKLWLQGCKEVVISGNLVRPEQRRSRRT